jgi:hypothetical protein
MIFIQRLRLSVLFYNHHSTEFLKKQFPCLFCRMCPLGNTKAERSHLFCRNLHIR